MAGELRGLVGWDDGTQVSNCGVLRQLGKAILCEPVIDHFSVHVGEAKISTLEPVGQISLQENRPEKGIS